MIPPHVQAKSAALEVLRAEWEARLLERVASKVEDAHAHAVKAVTDALKQTPPGRKSLLYLKSSRSYRASTARLGELWAWLTGPSEVSLAGKIRDAREAFYNEAVKLWFPLIPEEYRAASRAVPTAEQTRLARCAAIHGYDPRKALEGSIHTAARELRAILDQVGMDSVPESMRSDMLSAWEARTISGLSSRVRGLLSDSVEWCDTNAGRDLIKPEMLEE